MRTELEERVARARGAVVAALWSKRDPLDDPEPTLLAALGRLRPADRADRITAWMRAADTPLEATGVHPSWLGSPSVRLPLPSPGAPRWADALRAHLRRASAPALAGSEEGPRHPRVAWLDAIAPDRLFVLVTRLGDRLATEEGLSALVPSAGGPSDGGASGVGPADGAPADGRADDGRADVGLRALGAHLHRTPPRELRRMAERLHRRAGQRLLEGAALPLSDEERATLGVRVEEIRSRTGIDPLPELPASHPTETTS
jgi:hypothetical protein